MQRATIHGAFEEFANNLDRFFDQVSKGEETVVVESSNGAQVEVRPGSPPRLRPPRWRTHTPADHEAFLSSFGS